jgi:BirA family biotin operon repressor/biotin-[acetyl-CoA-carboxylase] ligase
MSILLRPERISPWSGFAVALAAAEAINEIAANPVRLKWPNDLLLNDSKVGGVIAEVEGSAVIVGLGLNVTTTREELPVDTATSLALEGVEIDREILIRSILRTLGAVLRRDDEELRADYLALLDTIGKRVRVEGVGAQFEGVAERVDQDGQLVVDGRSFAVGDVVHLR